MSFSRLTAGFSQVSLFVIVYLEYKTCTCPNSSIFTALAQDKWSIFSGQVVLRQADINSDIPMIMLTTRVLAYI